MKIRLAAACLLSSALLAPNVADAATGVPGRESDAIVVTGNDVPSLIGSQPGSIVAFDWDSSDGWTQVPVQVDQKKIVDYPTVRQGNQSGGRPFTHLAYADPGTYAGADPDPTLDADDEIAAMAFDAGDGLPDGTSDPAGVEAGTRTELRIVDSVDPGPTRFLYLFRTNSGLSPSAGKDYVDYKFKLNSGDYKTTYAFGGVAGGDNTQSGPPANPEDTYVDTPYYQAHLASRWIGDAFRVRAGGATGADILDGDKSQVSYGCGRSELTFSRGGGGFIANIDGPVRAIRSYIGANSGTFTQRDQVYYQRTEVDTTFLRVHPGINRISQFLDYSANAIGMTYRNSSQPAGVTIDGVSDPSVQTGDQLGPLSTWEQVTGPQGTLGIVNSFVTNITGMTVGSYYVDAVSPTIQQCSGYADTAAYGASGAAIQMPTVPGGINTDPTLDPTYGSHYDFTGSRTIFFGAPGGTADQAAKQAAQVYNPLQISLGNGNGGGSPNLLLRAKGLKKAEAGETTKIRAKLKNTGSATAEGVKVCLIARQADVGKCAKLDSLDAQEVKKLKLPLEINKDAKPKFRVRVKAESKNSDGSVDYSKVSLK